jgi:hypothetical protein
MTKKKAAPVDVARHGRDCALCRNPHREEIESQICEWKPLAAIAREQKISRPAIYRHARALGLFGRRDRNIKAALASFIERGHRVRVTAAAFVAAIQAYSKINAEGSWIDKTENVNVSRTQEMFDRMSRGEMLRYAESGELPAWCTPVTH